MKKIGRLTKLNTLLVAGILYFSAPLIADEKSKEIAWQDYAKATAEAKKANKPVLIDFWRPG
ncbi:MAG TPA: hypothetical protein VNL73_11245 [Verrucomicrobiae bacterium]|nr:hypothetical protein [Verrucomicrobiae bacterium]